MNFQQKLVLNIEGPQYRISTICLDDELAEVLEFRRRNFPAARVQKNIFDMESDHLIVRDLVSGKICGAYRVACTQFTSVFESCDDFNIDSLLLQPGVKLELAWACIDPEHRDGGVISMLWRGIAALIQQSQASLIFGVTSLFEADREKLERLQVFLSRSFVDRKTQQREGRGVVPALLRAYMLAGATVWPKPFYDEKINCYDFMTVWELESCPALIKEHFWRYAVTFQDALHPEK